MKMFKRNAVIVTVLVFVCAAVYLNWSYANKEVSLPVRSGDTEVMTAAEGGEEAAGLYFSDSEDTVTAAETGAETEYFDQVRLSRQRARDSAQATLTNISKMENADKATIDEALAAMVSIARRTEEEARLESLIKAKGFKDCVAYMTDESVTITVNAGSEGLSGAGAARIKDILLDETDYTADQMKIVEVK